MAIRWTVRICIAFVVGLLVPCVEAGNWQHCQRVVPLLRCSVGDSRTDGAEYRYDIARYTWDRRLYPTGDYNVHFATVNLPDFPSTVSCYNCTREILRSRGSHLVPYKAILIVDHNVGTLTASDTDAVSKIPCVGGCALWFVNCNTTIIEVGALAKLPHVKTLVIWQSNLRTLRNGTFEGMESLEEMALLSNNITSLEAGVFDRLPKLRKLHLIDNQILTMAPDTLCGLRLELLDVSANHLTDISDGLLQGTRSLHHLHVVGNKLQSISVSMFAELDQLWVLSLQYNEISSIAEGAFRSNAQLRKINLEGNKLNFLSGHWFNSAPKGMTVNVEGNAVAAVHSKSRMLGTNIFLLNNPLRCTCANRWLYEHLWARQNYGGMTMARRHSSSLRRWMISVPPQCPASSLMEVPPKPVDTGALRCPMPFVELLNVRQSHEPRYYEAFGSVYWEELPLVSWTLPNASQHSMNLTYNTNTTTHATLAIGNLTVRMVTYIQAEGWVKCNGLENKTEECSNYMGKSTFTLWFRSARGSHFWNLSCSAISEVGSYTAHFEWRNNTHFSKPNSTLHPSTEPTTLRPILVLLQGVDRNLSESVWPIAVVTLATILMILTRMIWEHNAGIKWAKSNVQGNNITPQGAARLSPEPNENRPASVENGSANDDPDDMIVPYAIAYDIEDDDITPYAEGHLRDLDESDASDSSEIRPYGVSKLCDKYVASSDHKKTANENLSVESASVEDPASTLYGQEGAKASVFQSTSVYQEHK
ncbi:uncharacterized protein [Branchiostoma lanceolatum]|uniref:uncharacterized protein n=1 Tax=Branchiostoma lanceolatum TaxID=7740 RepID=UPI0034565431